MKYYYKVPKDWENLNLKKDRVKVYRCNHPMYNRCTLFTGWNDDGEEIGLAVVQQHFNETTKSIWWGSIDPWIANDILENERFDEYFKAFATVADEDRLYYTVPLRKIMWALRMKPLKREFWEEENFNEIE